MAWGGPTAVGLLLLSACGFGERRTCAYAALEHPCSAHERARSRLKRVSSGGCVLYALSSAACEHAMFGSALQHQLGPNEPARSRLADLCRKQASANAKANAKANAARPADSGSVRGRSSQWCTVDLSKSDAWLRFHVAKAPTVTASHNKRSIFVTHPVDRFLLPQVPLQPSVPQSSASRCGSTARRTACRIARTHACTHARSQSYGNVVRCRRCRRSTCCSRASTGSKYRPRARRSRTRRMRWRGSLAMRFRWRQTW